MEQISVQDQEFSERLNILDNIYNEEQNANILKPKQINIDIDLESIEEALAHIEEDENLEFYEQTNELPDELIDHITKTDLSEEYFQEMNLAQEYLNNLDEDELNDFLYETPECLKQEINPLSWQI